MCSAFTRDLLTASAYGVNEFLFVYGDRPETGTRSDNLTVRSMIAEARRFASREDVGEGFRLGVATGLRSIPPWKHEADFLLTQVSFPVDDLLRWRATFDFDGPVFAGVMVLPSVSMARKLTAEVPQLAVPESIVRRLDADRDAGVAITCDLMSSFESLRYSTASTSFRSIAIGKWQAVWSRCSSHLPGVSGRIWLGDVDTCPRYSVRLTCRGNEQTGSE